MFGSQIFFPKAAYLYPTAAAKAVEEPVQQERQWLLLCRECVDVTGTEVAVQTQTWSAVAEVQSVTQLFALVKHPNAEQGCRSQCSGEAQGPPGHAPLGARLLLVLLSRAGKLHRERGSCSAQPAQPSPGF